MKYEGGSILVTGGTGLVGQAMKKTMPDAIYLGSKDYDLTKEANVVEMFEKYRPGKVIHLAARVGGIMDNVNYQADYFDQNILINTYVVRYAHEYGVKKMIAFGSNCAYPDVAKKYPLKEDQLYDGPPAKTNFSYAVTKRALLAQIQAYRTQFGSKFFAVIPCSLYGPNDDFDEQSGHFIAALIRKIHQAKASGQKSIKLFGSGRPLRQFMYSEDLAKIVLLLLERYDGDGPINIGPRENLSIRQIAAVALKALGVERLAIEFDKRKPDGQFRKDLDSDRLEAVIGDFTMTPLEQGIKNTYQWYLDALKGQKTT